MNTDITKQMEMVLYRTEDDNVTISALIKDETIWITQKAMAELFGVQTPAISKHLKNIFEQGELREEVVVSKMEIPTPHGAIPGKTQLSRECQVIARVCQVKCVKFYNFFMAVIFDRHFSSTNQLIKWQFLAVAISFIQKQHVVLFKILIAGKKFIHECYSGHSLIL